MFDKNCLLVSTLSHEHKIFYPTAEEAESVLQLIKTALNKDRYVSNSGGEKRENVFEINSPAGTVVIVLDQIQSVRVVDYSKHHELTAKYDRDVEDLALQRDLRKHKAFLELEKSSNV